MGLRIAKPEDASLVKEIVPSIISDSKYDEFLKNFILTDELLDEFLNQDTLDRTVCLFILDAAHKEVGLAAFEIMQSPLTNFKLARLVTVYVEPNSRKMGYVNEVLEALEYWGKKTDCGHTYVGVTKDNVDLTDKGYKKFEVVWMKDIK